MQQPYVVAHELTKAFDSKAVLSSVSFEVRPGDVIGVLGKNGAGAYTATSRYSATRATGCRAR
jgi:ABC-type multidrug transport system ATPase subunit